MTNVSPVFVILNGKGANNPKVRTAIKQFRKRGHKLEVRVTWEFGDAERYINEALDYGATQIIAGGGDGTINEVASAIAGIKNHDKPTLGILPLGTANDFASACQIPMEPKLALKLALTCSATPIDIGVVNDKNYFINMATGGFGTKVTLETPNKLKETLGGLSYLLSGIVQAGTLKHDSCTITADDFSWSGNALMIGIGNGKQAGGGYPLCPDAHINDGLLQLTILMSNESLSGLLTSLLDGKDSDHVIEKRLTQLNITSHQEMILNLDGEPLKGKNFDIKIIASAIECHLPADCPLLVY